MFENRSGGTGYEDPQQTDWMMNTRREYNSMVCTELFFVSVLIILGRVNTLYDLGIDRPAVLVCILYEIHYDV